MQLEGNTMITIKFIPVFTMILFLSLTTHGTLVASRVQNAEFDMSVEGSIKIMSELQELNRLISEELFDDAPTLTETSITDNDSPKSPARTEDLWSSLASINIMIDKHFVEESREEWGEAGASLRQFLQTSLPQVEEKYVRRMIEDYLWSKVTLSKSLSNKQSQVLVYRFLSDIIRQCLPLDTDYYAALQLSQQAAEVVISGKWSVDVALKRSLERNYGMVVLASSE